MLSHPIIPYDRKAIKKKTCAIAIYHMATMVFRFLSFILPLIGAAGMTAEEGWAHAEKVLREHIKAPIFPYSNRSIADRRYFNRCIVASS